MVNPCKESQRGAVIVTVALLVVAHLGSAQQQPPAPAPLFRTGVEVVHVDVSVLDRDRAPVRGLTAADFAISEDGTPQQIVSFSTIDVPPPRPPTTAWMREVAPDVRANLAAAERLIVILLDDAHVRPAVTTNVRNVGRQIVNRLGPTDLAAVVFTRNNSGAQAFTDDSTRLLKAVDSFGGGSGRMSEYFDQAAVRTLRYVTETLAEVRHQRKLVIYVGAGVSITGNSLEAFGLREDTRSAIAEARQANINIYAIDPHGLDGVSNEELSDPLDPPAIVPEVTQSPVNEFLRAISSETGAFAVLNRNEFSSRVNQIFDENSAYYVIGYQSSNPTLDGRQRKIDVRVNRRDVVVRSRRGYETKRVRLAVKATDLSPDLIQAFSATVPESGVEMQATAAPFANPGKKDAALAIVVALRQPLGGKPEERVKEQIDVLVHAFGPEGGKSRGGTRVRASLVLRPQAPEWVGYEILTQLQLKPGRYQLRMAADSMLQARQGSIHLDVDVPDFRARPLSLSGVVVNVEPNVASVPPNAVSHLTPIAPTTRREFWQSDRVSTFVRVYRLGRRAPQTIEVTARIVNQDDGKVFERSETFRAEQFGAHGSVDYRLDVPVATLPKGSYLLTIEAGLRNAAVRRDVRFTMLDN